MSRGRWLKLAGLAAVVVVAAGVALWWLLFRGDPAAPVDLATAVAQLPETDLDASRSSGSQEADSSSEEPSGAAVSRQQENGVDPVTSGGDTVAGATAATGGELSPAGIAGTWTIDASSGDFDFETASGSFVGFRVEEELTVGEVTAVGRTGAVSGSLELTETALVAASIEVDLTTIRTDRSGRDRPTRAALDTANFPMATFELSQPVEIDAAAAAGEPFSATAVGVLTIKGAGNTVSFDLDAQLVDDVAGDIIVVVGSSDVVFADYGIRAPSAPIVVSVEDNGVIEFQLLLRKTG